MENSSATLDEFVDMSIKSLALLDEMHESYVSAVDMWERQDEIYADYAHDIARSPLTWVDKKQAILNYVLEEGGNP